MDALKTIQLAQANNNIITGVVLNQTHFHGWYEMKPKEIEDILNVPIIAQVRSSEKIRKALHQQSPLNYSYPHCRSARGFRKVAEFLTMENKK